MVIGFKGKKGGGKTVGANYLASEFSFSKVNFKDSLIAEMLDTMPTVLNELASLYEMTLDELFKNKPPIMRALMQNYGTELRRNQDPNYWVDKWKEKIKDEHYTVDDVRFENEAQAIRNMGGIIVHINTVDDEHTDTHLSETEMENIEADFTIECKRGDLNCIYKNIENILQVISAD